MDSLAKDYEKLAKKHLNTSEVDQLINLLTTARDASPRDLHTITHLSNQIKQSTNLIKENQKEFHEALTKYGKAIDKRFKQDLTIASNPEAFANKDEYLDKTVALHFIRQGQFGLGETFIREAGLDIPEELKSQFVEMYQIVEALKVKNLEPALRWSRSRRADLVKRGSSLEFNLHRLQYMQLLTSGRQDQALAYAKQNIGEFGERHLADIKRLMTAVVFLPRLATSPYADLASPSHWADIQHDFTRDFCSLLGMSQESPLFISVMVGTTALPTIIKMATIMKEKKNEWSQQDELPVEVPLTEDLRYHSIFACPVSKEQASDENPPMMMPCGHVVCKESLNKLSKAGRNSARFKCPYCPSESTPTQAMRVYF